MNAHDHHDVVRLIGQIYRAGLGDEDWTEIARQMIAILGLSGATLVLHETRSERVLTSSMVNFGHLSSSDVLSEYVEHFHARNPQVLFQRQHPNALVYHDSVDPRFSSKAHREFTLWARDRVGIHQYLTGYCRPTDDLTFAFAFSGDAKAEDLDATKIRLFGDLMSHLRQAVALASRLDMLEGRNGLLRAALDRSRRPTAILGASGALVYANPAMEGLASEQDGVSLGTRGLRLLRRDDQEAFDRLCQKASPRAAIPSGGIMRANRPSGRQAYVIGISPLSGRGNGLTPSSGILVTVTDPDQRDALQIDPQSLRSLGLTAAEARLAVRLAAGEPVHAIADELGITLGTARSHLKSIFMKTNTHRQGELIVLLSTFQ